MTRDEYEIWFRSLTSLKLDDYDRRCVTLPCDCAVDTCKGWQWFLASDVERIALHVERNVARRRYRDIPAGYPRSEAQVRPILVPHSHRRRRAA